MSTKKRMTDDGGEDRRTADPEVKNQKFLPDFDPPDFSVNPFDDNHPKYGLNAARENTKTARESERRKKKRKNLKSARKNAPMKSGIRRSTFDLFGGSHRKRGGGGDGLFDDIGTGTGVVLAGALGLLAYTALK